MACNCPELGDLKELLTCPVCFNTFNNPRNLGCGHQFCEECLRSIADRHVDGDVICPTCRALTVVHGDVTSLPRAVLTSQIQETVEYSLHSICCSKACQHVIPSSTVSVATQTLLIPPESDPHRPSPTAHFNRRSASCPGSHCPTASSSTQSVSSSVAPTDQGAPSTLSSAPPPTHIPVGRLRCASQGGSLYTDHPQFPGQGGARSKTQPRQAGQPQDCSVPTPAPTSTTRSIKPEVLRQIMRDAMAKFEMEIKMRDTAQGSR